MSWDVITALKVMAALKAPGPYGYHAFFFSNIECSLVKLFTNQY